MTFFEKAANVIGTIVAIVVVIILGIIGWFIYKMLGIILTGLTMAGLLYYTFFYKPPKPKDPA